MVLGGVAIVSLVAAITACHSQPGGRNGSNSAPTPTGATAGQNGGDGSSNEGNLVPVSDLEAAELLSLKQPLTGDLDEIVRRRFLRALVAYDRTTYFVDRSEQRGIAYDALVEFEKSLRAASNNEHIALKVVIIPTSRDRLIPSLAAGYGDIAIGNLTSTPEREKLVDFSNPVLDNVEELVVTGQAAPPVNSVDDLSGKEVHVRASSSYRESLEALNSRLTMEGKAPVIIKFADELLEDEDLIQMTDAGVVGITVIDRHIATFWGQLYDRVKVNEEVVLRRGGHIAWAFRTNCPGLQRVVNDFIATHRAGTMFGNMMLKRYLGSVERLKNPTEDQELERFRSLVTYLRKYGDKYNLPWLLVTAQGYQESQLDQSKRSPVGAIGVMQIKPETAADVGVRGIETAENNIHAGAKYLRFILDRYFKDAPMDTLNKGLFALASYNSGPARVAGLRQKAEDLSLNPNVWFNNVEIVAAREIGRETVDYVSNIYKYYTAYVAIVGRQGRRAKATTL